MGCFYLINCAASSRSLLPRDPRGVRPFTFQDNNNNSNNNRAAVSPSSPHP